MKNIYKSTPKNSAFTPSGLSDKPLFEGVFIFNIMKTKTIKGYPNYAVTSNGDVISKNYKKSGENKILKPRYRRTGYDRAIIWNNKIHKEINVAREVAILFVNNPLNLPEVNHIDGNTKNNNYKNLEWCNRSYNVQHAYDYLNKPKMKGVRNGRAKLNDEMVLKIREDREIKGLKYYELMLKYKIPKTTLSHIIRRETWKHI